MSYQKEETIQVLYNTCLGRWNPSDKAMALYNARKKAENPAFVEVVQYGLWLERHDPVLVDLFYELGNKFDEDCSATKVRKISKKYKDYYYIENTEGYEDIIIAMDRYHLDKVKTILQNDLLTDKEKINEMKKNLRLS